MKNLTLITLLFANLLYSCGRDAEIIKAPTSFNEQVIGLQAFNTSTGKMEAKVRAFTLLFYPRPEHIYDFSYEVSDLARPSWETVLATLPYAQNVVTNYPATMEVNLKVQKMVAAIQSVGRSRDNAWREMEPLDRRMEEINGEKATINQRISEIEPNIDFKDFTCFYDKKPRRGKKYDCRTVKSDDFSKRKRPRGCDDLLEFEFTYENEEDEAKYEGAISQCAAVSDELAGLEAKTKELNIEFDTLFEKFEPLELIRKSGEAVVLDILQTLERYTLEKNNPQVYVATGSSKEKPNNQDILSEVKVDWQRIESQKIKLAEVKEEIISIQEKLKDPKINSHIFSQYQENLSLLKKEEQEVALYLSQPVEKFSLFIEFGLNYSGGTRSQEYSLANGRIKDFSLTWTGPNPTLNFKIINDDFWIECALDVTNDDEAMGYRAVGEVFAHYPDGSMTRGGMKLEFNIR